MSPCSYAGFEDACEPQLMSRQGGDDGDGAELRRHPEDGRRTWRAGSSILRRAGERHRREPARPPLMASPKQRLRASIDRLLDGTRQVSTGEDQHD